METKKYRSFTLRNYNDLTLLAALPDEEREAIGVVGQVLPFKSNNYVVEELINWHDVPNDPIYTLTFPRREMLSKAHYSQVKKLMDENDEAGLKKRYTRSEWNSTPILPDRSIMYPLLMA